MLLLETLEESERWEQARSRAAGEGLPLNREQSSNGQERFRNPERSQFLATLMRAIKKKIGHSREANGLRSRRCNG